MMIVIRARLKWTTQLKIQMQPHPRRSPMNQLVKCLNTHHHNILLDLVIILTSIIRDDIITWIFHIALSFLIVISKIRRRPSGPSSAHRGHRKDSSKALQLYQLHTGGNIECFLVSIGKVGLKAFLIFIPQSVHFAGFDAAAEKDLTYQVNISNMSTITIVSSFKYKRHIASMTPSIKYQLSFINQMSSFSENAALGYLKAQVSTESNPASDNELIGSGVCRLQQAANISTLSKGRAS